VRRKKHPEWKPTSSFLMEKYVRNQWESVFSRLGGYKCERSPTCDHSARVRYESRQEQPWNHQDWRQTRRVSPADPRDRNVATQGDQAAVDYGMPIGEHVPDITSSRTSDAIILVGSVLCQVLVEEMSTDRYRTPTPFSANQGRTLSPRGRNREAGKKRPRLVVNVGPGTQLSRRCLQQEELTVGLPIVSDRG
jgi:hypothetical protein